MSLRALAFLVAVAGCGCTKPTEPPPAKTTTVPAPEPASYGTISGEVTFAGQAPAAQPIDMSQDPACGMAMQAPARSEAYEVNQGKVANVLVYVKAGAPPADYPRPAPVTVDQAGCRYIPHVAAVMTGQTVRFTNSDPALHNVHAMPAAQPGWNASQQPRGEPLERTFAKAELMVPVVCNSHPWMKMYLSVLEHPFFAVTDAHGRFTIHLPPGEYTLAAVHERWGEKTAPVRVATHGDQTADFHFAAADGK